MRRKIVIAAALGMLVAAGTASALRLQAGDIVVIGDGGFSPKALPKHENAPITLHGGGRISTVSGELPPILETITFKFDRHGAVDTNGLAVCRRGQLIATDVRAARRACGDAIVGEGHGSAVVKFPEQGPIKVSSPITLFNGPKKHGNDTVFAHAHLDYPGPTTFIVPIEIERIHEGVYGYRTEATIPKIANGYGHPISGSLKIGRKWTLKGREHSYISARCETGHLQARGEFTFQDGTFLVGTFFRPCTVRK
jgi:hypothetical protein